MTRPSPWLVLAPVAIFVALLVVDHDPPAAQATAYSSAGAQVGGRVAPDGKTEIQVDLPSSLHQRNINSVGLGCCVFRSIDHAARWQNIPALIGFPEWMVSRGIPGGGYPGKVDDLIPKIAADRGLPVPDYLQVEGTDLEILKLATRTGRMVSSTYSVSPTGRYDGRKIDHMVNTPHADDANFAILDNNYIGDNAYEWLSPAEYLRSYALGGRGWAVILLGPPPPPPPTN